MPNQGNRLSYSCTTSRRNRRGALQHSHNSAYLNAIFTKRNQKRMYIKFRDPLHGEVIIWINTKVVNKMLDFLVQKSGKEFKGLDEREKKHLYGLSEKDKKKRQL